MVFKKYYQFYVRVMAERRGISIVEVAVSLFIIILILSIFSASLISVGANRDNQNKNFAYNFAEAELSALREYPFDNLTERIDGDFVGLAYNLGGQSVSSDTAAISPTQVVSVTPSGTMVGGDISSIALLPEKYYTDFTFRAYFKVLPSSSSDWQTGIIFRYQDIKNYYYWSITSGSLRLTKVLSGTPTVLWTSGQVSIPGTWYNLKVVAAGTSLKVYLDDVLKVDQSDSSLASGYLGFLGKSSVYYYFDNVHLESAIKNSDWLFDAETVMAFPQGFLKISPADLPGFAGKLTVQNYSGTEIKKITAKVVWQEKGSAREIELSTLRSRIYE